MKEAGGYPYFSSRILIVGAVKNERDTDAVTDKDNTPPGNPLDFADQELANCVIKQNSFLD